jgi:hypothetical protein
LVGPSVTPEDGVTRYECDRTQGPACAIAAGAATIYRNYFAPVGSGHGQTKDRQIDALAGLGLFPEIIFQQSPRRFLVWVMRNTVQQRNEAIGRFSATETPDIRWRRFVGAAILWLVLFCLLLSVG